MLRISDKGWKDVNWKEVFRILRLLVPRMKCHITFIHDILHSYREVICITKVCDNSFYDDMQGDREVDMEVDKLRQTLNSHINSLFCLIFKKKTCQNLLLEMNGTFNVSFELLELCTV